MQCPSYKSLYESLLCRHVVNECVDLNLCFTLLSELLLEKIKQHSLSNQNRERICEVGITRYGDAKSELRVTVTQNDKVTGFSLDSELWVCA